MKTKGIILITAQVQELQQTGWVTVYKAVKPEPRNGIRASVFVKSGFEDLHGYEVKPPYQIGQAVYVRETWNGMPVFKQYYEIHCPVIDHMDYWFKADDTDNNPDDHWRSSATMPREAARLFGAVDGVSVTKYKDMPPLDQQEFYFKKAIGVAKKAKERGENIVLADLWFWKIDIVKGEKPEDF